MSSNADCGVLIQYSKEYQKELANEVEDLKNSEAHTKTVQVVKDYELTRNSIRKCKENLIHD